MTTHWLEEAVEACGLTSSFPRDLETELPLKLPVTIVSIPGLDSARVREWLAKRHVHHEVTPLPRRFHGCMVARHGRCILFIDSEDNEAEQRFTLAHEIAHFLLDHQLPRTQALHYFGAEIREVLDGHRALHPEEALYAVLAGVPLGIQVRLMDRNPSGAILQGTVMEAEWRADMLAIELLAPAALARPGVRELSETEGVDWLESHFGLPPEEARAYALRLRQPQGPRFSIMDYLDKDGR